MEDMYMVVAVGANSLRIPCLFGRKEKLIDILKEAFKADPNLEIQEEDDKICFCPDFEFCEEYDYEKIFTSYYDGCGEAYCFLVQIVPVEVPCVEWDLD